MSVAFELGFVIALPIVGFGLLGKWLDSKHNTHYFVFLGIAVAIIFTSIAVYKRFAALIEKLNQAARNVAKNPENDGKSNTDNKETK